MSHIVMLLTLEQHVRQNGLHMCAIWGRMEPSTLELL